MVNFGFRELGLGRISSWCIADNTASARVLERLGFRQEGRLRRNEYFKGAGGIRCSPPCGGRNGRSWPSTGMSEAGGEAAFRLFPTCVGVTAMQGRV